MSEDVRSDAQDLTGTDPKMLYRIRHRRKLKYAALKEDGGRIWLRYPKNAMKLRGGATLDSLLRLNKEWEAVAVEQPGERGRGRVCYTYTSSNEAEVRRIEGRLRERGIHFETTRTEPATVSDGEVEITVGEARPWNVKVANQHRAALDAIISEGRIK